MRRCLWIWGVVVMFSLWSPQAGYSCSKCVLVFTCAQDSCDLAEECRPVAWGDSRNRSECQIDSNGYCLQGGDPCLWASLTPPKSESSCAVVPARGHRFEADS
jgi:hypothetical protein